jgi:hypothetical protein
MGMNDGALTPDERENMRGQVIAGARRLRPVGAHRTALITASVAVVLVAGVAVGALALTDVFGSRDPAPVTTPSPSTSSTATPIPSPTPSPNPSAPATLAVAPFGGDCDAVFTAPQVSDLTGEDMELLEPAWRSGADLVNGGLTCTWKVRDLYTESAVTFHGFAAAQVPDQVRWADDDVVCDAKQCARSGVLSDGAWYAVDINGRAGAAPGEVEAGTVDALWSSLDERVGDHPAPRAAEPTDRWWALPTCDDLVAGIDGPQTLGGELTVRPLYDDPAKMTDPGFTPLLNGTERSCTWTVATGAGGYQMWSRVIPGAGQAFPAILASPEAVEVEVPGAQNAVAVPDDSLWEGYASPLVATDGVNILVVASGPGGPGAADLAPVAAELLATLTPTPTPVVDATWGPEVATEVPHQFGWAPLAPGTAARSQQAVIDLGYDQRIETPEGVSLTKAVSPGYSPTYLFTDTDVRWADTREDLAYVKAPDSAG